MTTDNTDDSSGGSSGGVLGTLTSIFGDAVEVYKASKTPSVGSNGAVQPHTPNQPATIPLTAPGAHPNTGVPTWVYYAGGGLVLILVGALAFKALR